MVAIFSLESALVAGDDLKSAPPTKAAKSLYDAMRSQHHTVGLTKAPQDIARWWVRREHLNDWSMILSWPDAALDWDAWRIDQVREFLAEGWEVFAYIDVPGPAITEIAGLGVLTVTLTYPAMAVGWKEVAAPRAWSNVVTTMDNDTFRGRSR